MFIVMQKETGRKYMSASAMQGGQNKLTAGADQLTSPLTNMHL